MLDRKQMLDNSLDQISLDQVAQDRSRVSFIAEENKIFQLLARTKSDKAV